ncbi:MAG: hypothetical protein B7Y90_00070 [Alphaproteobacteria bacterium 32-64-14]|nr:MAG: hypothetical protein B7Y90_00070 [Alphaproteobacteria bacterium 32-64-14]
MRCLILAAGVLLLPACATEPVEEPAFTTRLAARDFEVRDYAPTIVAEITVQGDPWSARFEGFGPLADYIFANDRSGEKIAMTAPVTQAPREKIAMTAPVTQQAASSDQEWVIGFTMPASYSIETLPRPVDPDVRLVEVPARAMAVLSFTGLATEEDMRAASARLLDEVARANLQPKGDVVFAFYDPPWILPFFRRNEAMVEVRSPE